MPTLTRVPAVVDGLIALFTAATGLQVLDGPHVGEVMQEAICVGLSPDQSLPGYQVDIVRQEGYGGPRYAEEWTISSLLSITSGDIDMKALRLRAGEALAEIDAAIRAAHTGELWQKAALGGRMEWLPLQHPQGASVNVFFDVVGSSLL